jgi:hypothetical protein
MKPHHSLATFSKKYFAALAAMLLLGTPTLSSASGQSIAIVKPNFSAVPVQCSTGYAYQESPGGSCVDSTSDGPQQDFNYKAEMGWLFAPHNNTSTDTYRDGVTGPDTSFNPPSFTGLTFTQAAFLQGPSIILQKIYGFVSGQQYTLSVYLGSRYAEGCCDGNQTVLVKLDDKPIGEWKLASFTPFTLQTVVFTADTSGPHFLIFEGIAQGDHTAFFSGISIETSGD